MTRSNILAGLLLIASGLSAQPNRPESGSDPYQFSAFEGLPSSVAGSTVQDSLGYIWMGSYGGLVRYDGQETQVMYGGPVLPLVSGIRHTIIGGYEELVIVDPLSLAIRAFPLPQLADSAGLLHESILLDVREDSSGLIWLILRAAGNTTRRFLYRFDITNGEFAPLASPNRHPVNPTCIAVDLGGRLWAGTATNGLFRNDADPDTFVVYQNEPGDPKTLAQNGILTILPSSRDSNVVWVGSGDSPFDWHGTTGALNKLDYQTGAIDRIDLSNAESTGQYHRVWSLLEEANGNLWIGDAGAVHLIEHESQSHRKWYLGEEARGTGLPLVTHLALAGPDRLWLGAGVSSDNRRVLLFEPSSSTLIPISVPEDLGAEANDLAYALGGPMEALLGPSSLAVDGYGTLWAPTRGGMLRYEAPSRALRVLTQAADGLPGSRVRALHVDHQDHLWIGMQGAGLARFDFESGRVEHFQQDASDPASLSDRFVQTIEAVVSSPTQIWIGTGGQAQDDGARHGSLNRYSIPTGRVDRFLPSADAGEARIQALLTDSDGVVWVGRTDGFFRLEQQTGSFTEILAPSGESSGSVKSLALDANGRIWLGTRESDVFTFDRGAEILDFAGRFENGDINAILPAMDGKVWIGSDIGLHFVVPGSPGDLTIQPAASNDDLQLVQHVLQDTDGYLWVSSNTTLGGHGIISRLEPEEGAIDTTRGASQIPLDIWFRPPAGAKSSDGMLYFGGDGGVVAIDPLHLSDEAIPPTLAFSSFSISGVELSRHVGRASSLSPALTRHMKVAHHHNDIRFDYAGIHTAAGAQVRYAFRLDGYDSQWREAGDRRSAEYFKLDPGTYTFRVRARTENSAWSPERTVDLEISPPWWRTPAAYVSYILLLVGLLAGADRVLRRHVTRREQEKTKTRELAQARKIERAYAELKATQRQLVHAEKMASLGQLTAGIAHEVNNPINFVSSNLTPLRRDINDLRAVLRAYEEAASSPKATALFESVIKLKSELDLPFVNEEIDHLIDGMEQGTERTAEIVRILQRFSRQRMDEKVPADLHEGLDAALLVLNHQINSGVDVVKEYGELPEVFCFPGEINQVFLNLLTNALEAVGNEGSILIRTWRADDVAVISIRDTGPGIPSHIEDRIFDPFFTTRDVGAGAGLGLFISHRIVEEHHGTIEVASEVGSGTEFVITLPIGE